MTAPDALDRPPTAGQRSVNINRFNRVTGTGRVKPTIASHDRRDQKLVSSNESLENARRYRFRLRHLGFPCSVRLTV